MLASMLNVAYIASVEPISMSGVDESVGSPRSLLLVSKSKNASSYGTFESLRTINPSPPRSTNRFIEVLVDDELTVTDSSSDFDSQLDLDDQFFSD